MWITRSSCYITFGAFRTWTAKIRRKVCLSFMRKTEELKDNVTVLFQTWSHNVLLRLCIVILVEFNHLWLCNCAKSSVIVLWVRIPGPYCHDDTGRDDLPNFLPKMTPSPVDKLSIATKTEWSVWKEEKHILLSTMSSNTVHKGSTWYQLGSLDFWAGHWGS